LKGWLWHIPALALVVWWMVTYAAMPIWAFALSTYFSLSILKIRTFLEHRAHEKARGRSVVIEDRGPLALIFLNNNYHSVHHSHPRLAWYRLPALYFGNREKYLSRNDRYSFTSYAEVFRKHFWHAKDPVPHPLWPND
jgi:fatty acid desaturase